MYPCSTALKNPPPWADRQQHVVHGVLSLDLGGLERVVLQLIKTGRRRNQRISVICIEREGALVQHARELGATVYCLAKPAGRSMLAVQAAMRLLDTLKPDVIHTHQIGALWYLGQATKRLGRGRIVHTEHSDHVTLATTWNAKLRARFLWWRAGRLAQRFCCVSHDIAQSVQSWQTVSSNKIAVVLNGIDVESIRHCSREHADLRATLGLPQHSRVVGAVGRLVEVKQHSLLIRALPKLRETSGDVRLLIIGDGPERTNLEQLAAQLGVERYVVFAGYQPEPFLYGAVMDAFVMPSRHEGLPLALLEAWAVGLPVVCSAVGGMAKVVQHGKNGLLFPSGDAEALASSLCQALTCTSTAKRLADSGQQTVSEHFSSDAMTNAYAKQYELAGA